MLLLDGVTMLPSESVRISQSAADVPIPSALRANDWSGCSGGTVIESMSVRPSAS